LLVVGSKLFVYLILKHFLTPTSDHVNQYCAISRDETSNEPKLWMCYAGGAGFGGYGGYNGYHRRVRFFDIDMNKASIATYKRVEYGDTEKQIDYQIIVDSGRVRDKDL
jgi:hypothetical protein